MQEVSVKGGPQSTEAVLDLLPAGFDGGSGAHSMLHM